MAAGDIVTLRKPITFDKDTDDGTTLVVEAAAVMAAADVDILTTQIITGRKTKEGLTEATIVIVGRIAA